MAFNKLIAGGILAFTMAAGALGINSLRRGMQNKAEELLDYHFTKICDYETGNGSYEINYRIGEGPKIEEGSNFAVGKETLVHLRRDGNNWETKYSEHEMMRNGKKNTINSIHFTLVDDVLYQYTGSGNPVIDSERDSLERWGWAPENFAVKASRRCKYENLPAHLPFTDIRNPTYDGRQIINNIECDMISGIEYGEVSYCFAADHNLPSMPVFFKGRFETWTATDIRNSTGPIMKPGH